MASATAALRHLRLRVGVTSSPPSSSHSSPYSCTLFLHPMPQSNRGLVLSCSALSLRRGSHALPGLSRRRYSFVREKKGKGRRNVVVASLFGVGAPEALVIGVVALLVFGPKGLAEVARNLGKTLRAFQPTIRELQEVSKEFKSTLEREIGLDEMASSSPNKYNSATGTTFNQSPAINPNGKPAGSAYSSEDLLKVTEEQLAASAAPATTTVTADAPPATVESQGPQDATVTSTSSEAASLEAPVEATAVAISSEGPSSSSESSSETKSSEKATE
ncbi:Sec-independent protein translocase protein TatA [Rhynchospora pubera]|uniref:Sec-independent protein translocase protein TatA n=1 Tax=Rhynchospora pubera TaxID=906938 RepID=A0AAV8DRY7_9POAL|nr:Sec-independent protein translocase protein TatA [Rhynchospora pubera]